MTPTARAEAVRGMAQALGFSHTTFTTARTAEEDRARLETWCAAGKAAGMAWLTRTPERRASPTAFLPEAVSVISLGVSYFQGPFPEAPSVPSGRVARYAWGEDYHAVIEKRLDSFRRALAEAWGPSVVSRPAVDIQPLLERAFARRGGLGFVGKNTNLIRPGVGSFLFLADVVVNLDLPPDPPLPQGCGACAHCATSCPTGALDTPFSLDARLCLSYHTIENRGALPPPLRSKMGDWLFGCDDCQTVCPYNARALETQWPEFRAERGPGPWLALAEVLSLRSKEAFRARFGTTALARAKRAGLVRNACVVAANGGHVETLRSLLEDCLRADEDPQVRGHAAWALGRGGGAGAAGVLERALAAETHAEVRDEIRAAREGRA